MKTLLFLLAMSLSTAMAADKPVTIENEFLKVMVTPDGKFQITDRATGCIVAADGDWPAGRGASQTQMYTHPVFGNGYAILTRNGSVMMFPKLPFVLFRNSIGNDAKEAKVLNQVPVLSFRTEIGEKLKTMGTGGLQTPEKNPGSYAWLAIADPQTHNGVVAAWLTHDRGSGVVFSPVTNDQVRVEAQIDYGRLRILPGASTESETLAIGYFADARLGLEAWADAVAKVYAIKLPPQRASNGLSSLSL